VKKCPYCAEAIQDEAIVCKHCGRELTGVMSSGPRTVPPQERRRWTLVKVLVAGFAIILMIGWIGSLMNQGQTSPPRPAPVSGAPASLQKPPAATDASKSAKPPSVKQRVQDAVHAEVQEPLYVEINGASILVQWPISENITTNMTKRTAQRQLEEVVKGVHKSNVDFQTLTAEGTFGLRDTFGNSKKTIVVSAVFQRSTIERINWETFLTPNIYRVADRIVIHPAFQGAEW
jgi:hypothetical protein